jgi:hypothetical protein
MSALHNLHVRRFAVVAVAGLSIAACGVTAKTNEAAAPATSVATTDAPTTSKKPMPTVPSPTVKRTTTTTRSRTTTTRSRTTTTTGTSTDVSAECKAIDKAKLEKAIGTKVQLTSLADSTYCAFNTSGYTIISFSDMDTYGETDLMKIASALGSPKEITLSDGSKGAVVDEDYSLSGYTIHGDKVLLVLVTGDEVDASAMPELLQIVKDAYS